MLKVRADTCHPLPVAQRGRWWLSFALMPVLAAALLPKCPLCLMAVMSAAGLSFSIKASWLLPLTLFLLLTTIVTLAFQARSRRSYGTLILGIGAIAIISSGKFYFNNNPLTYSGVVILIAGSLWGSRRRRKVADNAECEC